MEYQEYLRSDEWHIKCQKVRTFWGNRCAVCNSGGRMHIHHRNYSNLYHEHFTDLILLCENCHATFHNINDPMRMFNQLDILLKGIPK